MSLSDIIEQGGTLIVDPAETSMTPDDFLAKFGNIVDKIGIVAKSEAGSSYYPSSTAPKDPRFGDLFSSFSQIASDIGIQVYALIHGNMDGFFSRDPNFQMRRSGGNAIEGYVCPTQETYWAYLAEVAAEIAMKNPIEGIILKDVNYPRELSCFCENCRRTFSSQNGIDRDYSLEQIKRNANVFTKWQQSRVFALRGMISTIVNRVHQEKKVEIISEVLIDPETNHFDGASSHFGQDINMLSQMTPHVLLHIHPWSEFPISETELESLVSLMDPILKRSNQIKNSLYLWNPSISEFNLMSRLADTLTSSQIFFTDGQPSSYFNRRSLHLDLGV